MTEDTRKNPNERGSEVKWEGEAHGLQCKVLFTNNTHFCGYCAVPKGHIAFEKSYNDVPVEVHGGLTYSDCRIGVEETPELCWFGFDCAHAGDFMPFCSDSMNENAHHWKLVEVIKETKDMARQLSELTLIKMVEHKLEYEQDWFKDFVKGLMK